MNFHLVFLVGSHTINTTLDSGQNLTKVICWYLHTSKLISVSTSHVSIFKSQYRNGKTQTNFGCISLTWVDSGCFMAENWLLKEYSLRILWKNLTFNLTVKVRPAISKSCNLLWSSWESRNMKFNTSASWKESKKIRKGWRDVTFCIISSTVFHWSRT